MKTKAFNPNLIAFISFVYNIGLLHLYKYHRLVNDFTVPLSINSLVTLLLTGTLLVLFVSNRKNINNKYTILIIFMFLYLIFYNLFHYFTYTLINHNLSVKYFIFNLQSLYTYLIYFLIGFYYIGYQKYYKTIYFLYALMTINTFVNIDFQTLMISFGNADRDAIGIYQFLGDGYAIFSLLTITLIKNKKIQMTVILLSMATLFILISRSSLYAYIIVVIIYLFVKYRAYSIIYLSILIFLIAILFINSSEYADKILDSRFLRFMSDKVDGSVDARLVQIEVGMEGIKRHWIIGDYGGDLLAFGSLGSYMHSYIELLRRYGIIPFSIFIYLLFVLLWKSFLWVKQSQRYSCAYDFFMLLTLFTAIEITFARSIGYPFVFMALGILAGMKKNLLWIHKGITK